MLNLTDNPIHSTMGFEMISNLSGKTVKSKSSNTLGRPRPIEVLGRGLGLRSNLLFVSEYSSTKNHRRGFFEMRCTI